MSGTGCFLYRSTCTSSEPKLACRAILAAARRRNLRLGLTGYLHLEDRVFYQWLEGPAAPLAEVQAMIERDHRHHDMRYLFQGTQNERKFSDWHMGFGISDPGTLFEWIAERGVAPMDTARFSEGILAFMQGMPGATSGEARRG